MGIIETLSSWIPDIRQPTQKRLPFKEKLKWTIIILVLFFILGMVPLIGLDPERIFQFEQLELLLGASMGSIISLGIGPMVTASIVLQLLNGSGILKFDLTSHEGKKAFQSLQKVMIIGFIVFEAFIYVFMGALPPLQALQGTATYASLQIFLVIQLIVGGLVIMFMDQIIQKWGIGSGISLFIAAGVSKEIIVRAISWLHPEGNPEAFIGAIPELFRSLSIGEPQGAMLAIAGIVATLIVFGIVVYVQSMRVEIPLSFGRVRGHGVRWPLKFLYTSNIPVILIAALLANVQIWAQLFTGSPNSAIGNWVNPTPLVQTIIHQGGFNIGLLPYLQTIVYMLFMMGGAVLFSYFWVQTAGLDARSQAKQIMASGLQVPGFRKDIRVLERLLNRYIMPLTIMGGLAVGALAGLADISGALSRGTGILLAVMIVYQMYEQVMKDHMYEMNPAMKKFVAM